MLKNKLSWTVPTLISAALLTAPLAFARQYDDYDDRYNDRYSNRYDYDDEDYDGGRISNSSTVYADVVSARPITRLVEFTEPRQECWTERVRHERASQRPAGTLIGALVGAGIGNAVGKHHSDRSLATVGGAVAGGVIGSNVAHGASSKVVDERHCRTVQERHTEERTDGYDVTYRYGGRLYHTRTPYDPGRTIRVQLDVTPLRN